MLRYEGLEFRRVMFAGKRVRVVAIGQQTNFDIHAFFKQHINASDRSLYTCSVAVIEHSHIIGEPVNHTDLSRCKSRSRRSYHVFYTGLMHGNNIRIALDQKTTVLFHNRLFGEVDTV